MARRAARAPAVSSNSELVIRSKLANTANVCFANTFAYCVARLYCRIYTNQLPEHFLQQQCPTLNPKGRAFLRVIQQLFDPSVVSTSVNQVVELCDGFRLGEHHSAAEFMDALFADFCGCGSSCSLYSYFRFQEVDTLHCKTHGKQGMKCNSTNLLQVNITAPSRDVAWHVSQHFVHRQEVQLAQFSQCKDAKMDTTQCNVEAGVSLQWDGCPAGFLSITLRRASSSDGSSKHKISVKVGEMINLGRHSYKPVACFIHSGRWSETWSLLPVE